MPCRRAPGRSAASRPMRTSAGRLPSTRSNASRPELHRLRVGRHEPGRRRRPELDLELGVRRVRPRAGAARPRARSPSTVWPGASRIETFATASTGSTVFWRCGEPLAMPFTSSAGSRERAQVELLGRARRPSARAPWRRARRRRRAAAPSPQAPPSVGAHDPLAQRLGERAVLRDERAERLHERVRRVERSAAVDAGVEVALAGPQRDVEVDEAARRDVERGQPRGGSCRCRR